MNLSSLYTSIPDYLEYAWKPAPNAAGQAVSANSITTLTMDTEVSDLGGHGSINAGTSTITLNAGTYYYEALTNCTAGAVIGGVLYLYNGSSQVSGASLLPFNSSNSSGGGRGELKGNLVLTTTGSLTLRLLVSGAVTVETCSLTNFTLSTANADQRTTIKLWKLK